MVNNMRRAELILAPVLLAAIPFEGMAAKKPSEAKKNVIFIITDDMRLDMTGFGGGLVETPNLDALSQESVMFNTACTTTGLSSPSRTALFTGQLGHRTGLEDNLHLWRNKHMTLPKEQTTIFEWANEAGYNVGYFGKWHVGYFTPDDRGASSYGGSASDKNLSKPQRPSSANIEKYYDADEDSLDEKSLYYTTIKTPYEKTEAKRQVDLGIKFIEESKADDRPIFLTLSFYTPHPAYRVPAPWDKMYNYKDVVLPESYKKTRGKGLEFQQGVWWPWMDVGHMSDNDWRKTVSYSMGLCTMFDKAIGEFFQTLKDNDLWDDTLIIFTSDQGTMLAEHTLYDKGPYSFDGLMRIPMIVKTPGVKPHKIDRHVSLIDLNNTMVEYMGLKPTQDNIDSRSMLPLIYKENEAWDDEPDVAFYRYEYYNGHWFGVRTIRTHNFKYTFNPAGSDELYDLKSDPNEMKNLIDSGDHTGVKESLQAQLRDHLLSCEDMNAYKLMMNYVYNIKL